MFEALLGHHGSLNFEWRLYSTKLAQSFTGGGSEELTIAPKRINIFIWKFLTFQDFGPNFLDVTPKYTNKQMLHGVRDDSFLDILGGASEAQWAKIKVHSTLIRGIYENGQIYDQYID